MYLVRAIIRTEKVNGVLSELVDAGFPSNKDGCLW